METEEKTDATTINREIGAWIRELRRQWMAPAKKTPDETSCLSVWVRFAYSFVGALAFMGVLFLSRLTDPDLGVRDISATFDLAVPFFIFMVLYSIWFSWLVSWRDFGHGPVRLFLSGTFLPAFVYSVIAFATATE